MNPDDLMMFLQNAAGGGNTGNSTPSAASASAPSASPSSPAPPMPAPPPLPSSSPDLYSLAQPTGGQVPQLGPPQLPQQQQRIQGVKGYLSNFLYGVGESLKASAGLETDAQRQQRIYNNDLNQRKFSLDQAQTQAAIGEHLARVQQMQSMVTIMGPNGPVQVPFALAKPYLESQAKVTAAQIGKRFIVQPNVGVWDTQSDPTGRPQLVPGSSPTGVTITPDMVTYNGIPAQLVGRTIPLGQFAQLERGGAAFAGTVSNTTDNVPLANGFIAQVPKTTTTQKVFPITGRPAASTPPASMIDPATGQVTQQSIANAAQNFQVQTPRSPTGFRNVAPMSGPPQTTTPTAPSLAAPRKPVNMTTRGGVKILTDNNGNPLISKTGGDTGYAFDPQTNENVITTRADAAQKGYLNFNKANPAQVSSDMRMNNQLGDVAQKITRYRVASDAISDDDSNKIAYLLNTDRFKLGAFGVQIPVDEINTFLKQHQLGELSPQGVQAFNAYLQARESLVGYNRILSGSSRSNEKQLELLLQALPDPTQPRSVRQNGINQFIENIHIAGNGLPRVPGVKRWSEYFNGDNGGGTVAPEGTIVQTGSGKQIKQGGKWVPYNQ